jgi:type IV pilus assembly protein PilP
MLRRSLAWGVLGLLILAAGAWAQEPAPPAGGAAAAPKAPAPEGFEESDLVERATQLQQRFEAAREEALADNVLGYDPGGRRDPFRPLVGVTVEQEERGKLPGIAGLHWEELSLIGVVETPEGAMAIFFGGPEMLGYFVKEGMNFYNGSVHRIDPIASVVTIRQKVEDRNTLKPWRDIDVRLHPLEETGGQ